MPITRGTILGYDASRMTYQFTMMDGPHIIDCHISSPALDDLAGRRWQTPRVLDRDAQFLEFRDQIEKLASDQFDSRIESKPKLVRIFAKHIPRRGGISNRDRSGPGT
jgi:hypothetical protein